MQRKGDEVMTGKEKTGPGAGPPARGNAWQVAPADSFITDDDLFFLTKARMHGSTKNWALIAPHRRSRRHLFRGLGAERGGCVCYRQFQWLEQRRPSARAQGNSGIWEGFIPGVGKGTLYKYLIRSRLMGYRVDKADPFSIFNEIPPKTASIVWDLDYSWGDRDWMAVAPRT